MSTTLRNTDILFNDGTTQSTAATAQSTAYGAVGTYVIALISVALNTTVVEGTTYAAASLVRLTDQANSSDLHTALNTLVADQAGGYSVPTALQGQLTSSYTTTSLGLSGTWRTMTRLRSVSSQGYARNLLCLFVRIS